MDKLFEGFSPIDDKIFREKIEKDLKGKDYQDTLVWTSDNIEIQPYYTQSDIENTDVNNVHRRGLDRANSNWEIRQDIHLDDVKTCNALALKALESGANALGLSAADTSVFKGVELSYISTYLSGENPIEDLQNFKTYLSENNIDLKSIKGGLEYNPFANLDSNIDWSIWKTLARETGDFNLFSAGISDGTVFHNASAGLTTEMALTLAQANEMIHQLVENGMEADVALAQVKFSLSVSTSYFMELAKLRAFRTMWASIAKQYQPKANCSLNAFVTSRTSAWNQAVYDEHNNLLRATTEAMSAIMGGANALVITPFDAAYAGANDFSLRLSRNIHHLLKEESYLDKVQDPAAGSYYIEALTDQIIEETWAKFMAIENVGGLGNEVGMRAAKAFITEDKATQLAAIADGKTEVLGVNLFPNKEEKASGKWSGKGNENRLVHTIELERLNKENVEA